ncbi:hypothetical protein BDV12DRAFT_180901 [Aspergillus spectabilis]
MAVAVSSAMGTTAAASIITIISGKNNHTRRGSSSKKSPRHPRSTRLRACSGRRWECFLRRCIIGGGAGEKMRMWERMRRRGCESRLAGIRTRRILPSKKRLGISGRVFAAAPLMGVRFLYRGLGRKRYGDDWKK